MSMGRWWTVERFPLADHLDILLWGHMRTVMVVTLSVVTV